MLCAKRLAGEILEQFALVVEMEDELVYPESALAEFASIEMGRLDPEGRLAYGARLVTAPNQASGRFLGPYLRYLTACPGPRCALRMSPSRKITSVGGME